MSEVDAIATIRQALLFLAGRCDGAQSMDGVGFNGRDAMFGKAMAARVAAGQPLTPNMLRTCANMLRTYARSQLAPAGIVLPDPADIATLPSSAPAAPRSASAPLIATRSTPRSAGRIFLWEDAIVVAFQYDPKRVDAAKALRAKVGGPGFRRDYEGQPGWGYPVAAIEAVIAAFPDLDLAPEIAAIRANIAASEVAEVDAATAHQRALLTAAGDLSQPLADGRVLYAHQRAGVEWLLRTERAILADEMGVGKTAQALVAAKAYGLPIFIVCPLSLKANWLREAALVGVTIQVFSWAKLPQPLEGQDYVLIADEAHYAQTFKAKRTQDLIALARNERCQACYLLTGTPIRNGRPANLFPLLYAIQHPIARNKKQFELRYCNAGPTQWSQWDATGAAHLDELHQKIRDVMLRRTKNQCLDLPSFTRVLHPVALSAAAQRQYTATLATLRADYQARIADGTIASEGEALVMLGHLRRAGSVAKAEATQELLEDLLDEGQQVVVFSAFRETLDILTATLNSQHVPHVVLTGETASKDRDGLVQQFQSGTARVFLCTFGAGGVGITLTAGQHVILIDRPWTPGDAMQAEGRIDRIGQTANTTAYWLQESVIDPKIDQILIAKQARIQLVMEGQRKTMRGTGDLRKLAREILAFALTGKGGQTLDQALTANDE